MTLKTLLLLASLTTTAVSACGGDDESGPATTGAESSATFAGVAVTAGTTGGSATTTVSATASGFGQDDVQFAQGMIVHHEQAIAMAEIALDPTVGASTEVTDLARRVRDAQDPEIARMTEWLEAWGQPVTMSTSDGHDMSGMPGMMSPTSMEELGSLTGEEFDRRWLEMMIEHHEGAIAMAETERAEGANPDAVGLAGTIISTQQGEIDEMNGLLG